MTQTTSPAYYTKRLVLYMKEMWRRREFAWFLAMGNFKARNASTVLGLFWWVLSPILLSLVYFFVFGLIFPGARDIVYLMSGMFVFHFTAQSLTGGANSILQNSKLLVNLKFSRLVLPLANILASLIGFLVSLAVLLAVQAVLRGTVPGVSILLLFVVVPYISSSTWVWRRSRAAWLFPTAISTTSFPTSTEFGFIYRRSFGR